MWIQRELELAPRARGFHLITDEVVRALPELSDIQTGMAQLFVQHTSASLTINENASPDVRRDLEAWANVVMPEDFPYWTHTFEGPDDMPAHVKASVFGHAVSVPIRRGRLALGVWQGLYLGEHRDRASGRTLIATLWGETEASAA